MGQKRKKKGSEQRSDKWPFSDTTKRWVAREHATCVHVTCGIYARDELERWIDVIIINKYYIYKYNYL